MSVWLSVLASTLVALLVIVILALATPIQLCVVFRTCPRRQCRIRARFIAGLTPAINLVSNPRTNPKQQRRKVRPKPKSQALSTRRATSKAPRIAAALPAMIMRMLRQIRFDHLSVDADIGLGDPAATGQLYGLVTPLIYAMPLANRISILVRPDFGNRRFSGEIDACMHVTPLALVPAAVQFAWRVFGPNK